VRKLTVSDEKKESYLIKDGDIPCTPEIEPAYSYVWNFCRDVTEESFPGVCSELQSGAALQYINRSDGYQECNVIGLYDPLRDDTYFSLLDGRDPSKGVSMKYQFGHKCPSGKLRSATVNIKCADVVSVVESAEEPSKCDYHLVMQSQYGCPLQCPITKNGLCNAHGHCAYDNSINLPRCYCNTGYGGKSCEKKSSTSNTSGGGGNLAAGDYSVEIGLLVVLLLAALILTLLVAYMAFRITEFRKEQLSSYAALQRNEFTGTEMVDTSTHNPM